MAPKKGKKVASGSVKASPKKKIKVVKTPEPSGIVQNITLGMDYLMIISES